LYSSFKSDDPLEQGDVLAKVPLPLCGVEVKFQGNTVFHEAVPTKEIVATNSKIACAFQMPIGFAMVLSQTCDLQDASDQSSGRVLLAPVLPDDDDRFAKSFEKALLRTGSEAAADLLNAVAKGQNAADQLAKKQKTMEKTRDLALTKLWLGQVVGAFPLASASGQGLSRSICYFDNCVSVPATWLPFLQGQRVLRLKGEWHSVLQESLREWLGRFAYPGSNDERLNVGGLGPLARGTSAAPSERETTSD
jgi:hypothetical protein